MASNERRPSARRPKDVSRFGAGSENESLKRYFFYIRESKKYVSLTRSSSVMKSFNQYWPEDGSWKLGEFYPLEFGTEGTWKGCLLLVGSAASIKVLEKKVSKFITEHEQAGNLTDSILQEFVIGQQKRASIQIQDTDSSNEEQCEPASKRPCLMEGNSSAGNSSVGRRVDAEFEKMQQFQLANDRSIDLHSDLEDEAGTPKPEKVTLSLIYAKLNKMDAHMRSEFRKLKKNSKEAQFQRAEESNEEFTDVDGNRFSLTNLNKSNPSTFMRQFALKRYGLPYLLTHVVEPGKKTGRPEASKEVVQELKTTLYKVFKPASADTKDVMWRTVRKSLNQKSAEENHSKNSSKST